MLFFALLAPLLDICFCLSGLEWLPSRCNSTLAILFLVGFGQGGALQEIRRGDARGVGTLLDRNPPHRTPSIWTCPLAGSHIQSTPGTPLREPPTPQDLLLSSPLIADFGAGKISSALASPGSYPPVWSQRTASTLERDLLLNPSWFKAVSFGICRDSDWCGL